MYSISCLPYCLFVCLYTVFEFANQYEHKCSMTRQRICYYVTGKEGGGENKEKKRENGRYLNEERSVIKATSKPANDSSVTYCCSD